MILSSGRTEDQSTDASNTMVDIIISGVNRVESKCDKPNVLVVSLAKTSSPNTGRLGLE
jgi:hypothetical protein